MITVTQSSTPVTWCIERSTGGSASVIIAAAMVALALPPALRSLHQITGVLLWVTTVIALTLARRANPAAAPVPPSIAVIIARGAGG